MSAAPGDTFDFSNATALRAPNGESKGPGGQEWLTIWADLEAGQDRIPASAPYGVWQCTGCDTVTEFRIVLEDGTAVDRPLYGVQLLLWDGA